MSKLVIPCVRRLPEDGTSVPKHVGFGTNHELCFMVYILLYVINLLQPTGHVMHHQFIQQLYALPTLYFMCFVFI